MAFYRDFVLAFSISFGLICGWSLPSRAMPLPDNVSVAFSFGSVSSGDMGPTSYTQALGAAAPLPAEGASGSFSNLGEPLNFHLTGAFEADPFLDPFTALDNFVSAPLTIVITNLSGAPVIVDLSFVADVELFGSADALVDTALVVGEPPKVADEAFVDAILGPESISASLDAVSLLSPIEVGVVPVALALSIETTQTFFDPFFGGTADYDIDGSISVRSVTPAAIVVSEPPVEMLFLFGILALVSSRRRARDSAFCA
ncbi:hypothetical protein [Denitrobaculum tricleocarpae]|uniref:Uncharacterized protein n=1 Tax=Denitrobaculum tricleocarpae TaxID=2591009 RepID=A0A545SSV0_9PROT|nr:hypothetical protein [Denitrobaculum tricleocarpae]TQV68027.1 hypothetical protein FKG95_29415 [Denitrobaculum tricleocarpae]